MVRIMTRNRTGFHFPCGQLSPVSLAVSLALLFNAHQQDWPLLALTSPRVMLDLLNMPIRPHVGNRHAHYYLLLQRAFKELLKAGAITSVSNIEEQRSTFMVGTDCPAIAFTSFVVSQKKQTITYSVPEKAVAWFRSHASFLVPHIQQGALRLLWRRGNEVMSKLYWAGLMAGGDQCVYAEPELVTDLLCYSAKHISQYRPQITDAFIVLAYQGFITKSSCDLPSRKGVVLHRWRLITSSTCSSNENERDPINFLTGFEAARCLNPWVGRSVNVNPRAFWCVYSALKLQGLLTSISHIFTLGTMKILRRGYGRRMTRLPKEKLSAFLELYLRTCSPVAACKILGLQQWQILWQLDHDYQFREDWRQVQHIVDSQLKSLLLEHAVNGVAKRITGTKQKLVTTN